MDKLIGENIIVRTVGYHYVGRLMNVIEGSDWLVLESATWIADSGRWGEALAKGFPASAELEVYPAGEVLVRASSVLDLTGWQHDLPTVSQ